LFLRGPLEFLLFVTDFVGHTFTLNRMKQLIEKLFAAILNRLATWRKSVVRESGLKLGLRVSDSEVTDKHVAIPATRRPEHIAILGKTGTGKSTLIRYSCYQDIEAGHGFIFADLHGDATPKLLSKVAEQEAEEQRDLSEKLIVVNPADPEFSVGLNPLEGVVAGNRFVRILEFTEVLKHRWNLHSFGARTDELLRNSLYAIAENDLTLVELMPFLSNDAFRVACLQKVTNPEVRNYFESRFDQASPAMKAVMREPILNKTSAFTADQNFRHIVGQVKSTFSLLDAMEQGKWVILNLHKGLLGEGAVTLGSMFLTTIKNTLFSRRKRQLFTVYADEVQNLVALGRDVETMLSEARKFGVSICTANQFLDQYPSEMRSAILAVGTHIFFRLSSSDAQCISGALDGHRPLAELLRNLRPRHLVVKSGSDPWQEVVVPDLKDPSTPWVDLYKRSRQRWARPRSVIESEITDRLAMAYQRPNEVLNEWE
jgi:hypothetical protein